MIKWEYFHPSEGKVFSSFYEPKYDIRIKLQSYEMKELRQKLSLTSELAKKSYDLDWKVPLPMPKEDK
ncbi:MAG: hypothetical protein ACQEXX_09805 [Bacillota bacterium]